jgi:diguanylate cyclase (GGDEF)-like protein
LPSRPEAGQRDLHARLALRNFARFVSHDDFFSLATLVMPQHVSGRHCDGSTNGSRPAVSEYAVKPDRCVDEIILVPDYAGGYMLIFAVVFGLGVLILGRLAVWVMARRVSEPLQKLRQGVAMLGAGNLTHRVEYARNDAFGELVRDFNQMSDQLQQNLSKLQHSHTLQAQRIEAHARELIAQTNQDALTGLANRGRLHEFMEHAIQLTGREGKFALLLVDLDGFKDINVSEGHAHGDRLLRVVARRLQGQIQEGDLAARVGSDEFCLLLMNVDVQRTTEFARRCLNALNAPIYLDGTTTRPRASVGITFYPDDAETPAELLKAADMAMYAAKSAGKHRYALYETGMTQKVARQLALESSLRQAVECGEFKLHYQPQIELGSGRMSGVEALIRWPRPEHGLVPPDEFIPVAERIGLIDAIGVWVLETACRQAVIWQQEGLTSLVMAVNISPGHFESPGFTDTVARVLLVTGIAPECLEIEVTESVTRDSLRHASISESLRRLGVRVAIDDFGTGYSSLAVLKKMPIDTLKLDRAFIRDMLEDSGSSMLIGTLIGMAKGLHLTTVAEGVETLEQVRVLTALGCPLAQGYYFSRPVTADLIPALARTDFMPRAADLQAVAAASLSGSVTR